MNRSLFDELEAGDTFTVHPEDGSAVYMKMSTGSDALAITGPDAGRVFEWPGWMVYERLVDITPVVEDDTDVWNELTPAEWADLDDENQRLMASIQG